MKKRDRGFTIFFTGLPSAGKSTLAKMLYQKLRKIQQRELTLLDGDNIRRSLSKGLGFSKKDRITNVTRIGFVANEITKHNGIAICAAIAPYTKARNINRKIISKTGTYIEVYVSTPLEICIKRDVKGLYNKAKSNKLKGMTGIDDPYEVPENAEITINTTNKTPKACIEEIEKYLQKSLLIS